MSVRRRGDDDAASEVVKRGARVEKVAALVNRQCCLETLPSISDEYGAINDTEAQARPCDVKYEGEERER